MRKITWRRIFLCGLVAGLAGTLLTMAGTAQTPAPAGPTAKSSTEGNLRVLFIGNSLTHMNDLPGLTARLAASARPLETEFVGEGGATLKRHWEAGRALEKQFWRAEVIRNTFNLLRAEGEFSVQFEKREKVGETEADVILIRKEGESVRLFVEPASGTLLKKAFRGMGTGGLADIEHIYFDYRELSGIQVPFRIEINQNGFPLGKLSINEVKINTGADPAELGKKPQ